MIFEFLWYAFWLAFSIDANHLGFAFCDCFTVFVYGVGQDKVGVSDLGYRCDYLDGISVSEFFEQFEGYISDYNVCILPFPFRNRNADREKVFEPGFLEKFQIIGKINDTSGVSVLIVNACCVHASLLFAFAHFLK